MALGVEHARNLGRDFMTYNWEILFNGVPGADPADMEEMSYRCRAGVLPGFTSEAFDQWFKRVRRGRQVSRTQWDDTWEVTFREGEKLQIYRIITDWKFALSNPSTGGGDPSLLPPDIPLRLLDDNDAIKLTCKLLEVEPLTLAGVNLEWEGGGPGDCQVTFKFNDIKLDWA